MFNDIDVADIGHVVEQSDVDCKIALGPVKGEFFDSSYGGCLRGILRTALR